MRCDANSDLPGRKSCLQQTGVRHAVPTSGCPDTQGDNRVRSLSLRSRERFSHPVFSPARPTSPGVYSAFPAVFKPSPVPPALKNRRTRLNFTQRHANFTQRRVNDTQLRLNFMRGCPNFTQQRANNTRGRLNSMQQRLNNTQRRTNNTQRRAKITQRQLDRTWSRVGSGQRAASSSQPNPPKHNILPANPSTPNESSLRRSSFILHPS